MGKFLLFQEYPEKTVPQEPVYANLLQEHLSADKGIDLRKQWASVCEYSDEKMKWIQSVCNFPPDPIQKKYEELFQLWFSLCSSYEEPFSPFSPFRPFICALAHQKALDCPESFYLPAAEKLFHANCGNAIDVLTHFYRNKVDRERYPCWEEWLTSVGYLSFFQEYPIFFRLIVDCFLFLINGLKLLFERLEHDRIQIAEEFNIPCNANLTALKSSNSDRHDYGQCVHILQFDTGQKLVYKPHSLATDAFWAYFVQQFNSVNPNHSLRAAKVLDRECYGYSEFIEYTPYLDEMSYDRYFERCGTLLSVLSMFGGSDFHYENLIISDGFPVLVDVETLITPWAKACYTTEVDTPRWETPSIAISRTLLLSKWVGKTIDGAVNIGSFCSFGVSGRNLPHRNDGRPVTAEEYIDAFIHGFELANGILENKRDTFLQLLNGMKDLPIRFVLRNTRTYYELLDYFTDLRGLRDGSSYECVTSRLFAAFLLSCNSSTLKKMLPAIRSEQDSIKRRDIPLFYSHGDSTTLFGVDGNVLVTGFFELSPIEIAKRNLSAINSSHTKDGSRFIHNVLRLRAMQNTQTMPDVWSYSDCVRHRKSGYEAYDILEQWIRNTYRIIQHNTLSKDDMVFYAPKRDILNGRYEIEILSDSLYNGRYGIICFLLMYSDYTKNAALLQNAGNFIQKQLNSLLDRHCVNYLLDLSFTEGLAGLLLLTRNYCIITQQKVMPQVFEVICRITPLQISSCTETDYFNGLSGLLYTICSLCALSEEGCSKCSSVILYLVDVILCRRNERGWYDPNRDYAPLTGLAHGQIGYALALTSALSFLPKRTAIITAIKNALSYESNAIDQSCFNLPDYRRFHIKLRNSSPNHYVPRYMHGNCSGIIGSTVAILKIRELLDDRHLDIIDVLQTNEWLQVAQKYLEGVDLVGNDSFCCGTAAWIDLLNKIQRTGEGHDWAAREMWSIVTTLHHKGIIFNALSNEIEDISLFKGITGIGYCALRIKGCYPSVLL